MLAYIKKHLKFIPMIAGVLWFAELLNLLAEVG